MDERHVWAARLRAERRSRLWSLKDMAARLRAVADEPTRERLPHTESLRRMIRSWEAGAHRPSELYAELYRRAFGAEMETAAGSASDAAEYAGAAAEGVGSVVAADSVLTLDDEERLVRAARAPRRLDAAVINSLAVMLAEQRRTEDRIGSVPLIAPVRAQLAVVEKLVIDARGPLRGPMLDLGGQWAQFAGWLHASAGRWTEADRHYDRALQWGSEAGNVDLIATALNMKGHLAWLSRTAGPLIGLSQAAQRDRAVSPGVRALAVQQEARGLALAGEADATDRKFDEAADLAVRAAEHPEEEPPWIYFFSLGYLTLQRGLAYRYLGRYGEAIKLLHEGLQALEPQARHAEWAGAYVLQMAIAHAALGDVDQACSAAGQVVGIAEQTESSRLRAQLLDLHGRLLRDQPRNAAVADLGERLR